MSSQPTSIPADVLIEHGAFVRALARNLLVDEHLADDVAQEAWVRYLDRPPRSALDPRNWFAIVVRNLARNARHADDDRHAHESRAARKESTSSPDDDQAQATVLREVVEAVLALDEPYRATVLARYFRDAEPARIARETGVPVATVKSRLQRALAQLRERLDRRHGARANWALALGKLAGIHSTTAAGVSVAAWCVGIAAVLVVAIGIAWRVLAPTSGAHEQTIASAAIVPVASNEPSAVDTTHEERVAPAAAAPAGPVTTFRVAGHVRDIAYEPLALVGGPARGVDVTVQLVTRQVFGKSLASATVATDDDGAFVAELANPTQRPCYLFVSTARTAERRASRLEEQVDPGVDARSDVELVRAAHGFLEGVVVDLDGAPVPNARLSVRSSVDSADVREIVADEHGAIRAQHSGEVGDVKALDRDSVVVSFEQPVLLDGGGSTSLRVFVARSAGLSVRVVDAQERGVEGIQVRAELDESELRQVGDVDRWDRRNNSGTSGPDGRVELDGLWADCKLQLSLGFEGESHQASSARGDELVFDDGEGAPIVVTPGVRRELVARWTGDLLLVGSTRAPDGKAIPDAQVEITRDHQLHPDYVAPMARLRSGPDGTFSKRLRPRDPCARLRIVAAEKRSPAVVLEGLGYMGGGGPTDGAVGRLLLDTSSAIDGTLRADVVLEPTLTIAGRVLDAEGLPITRTGLGGSRLWIVPAGTSSHRATGVGLGLPGSTFRPDGTFLFFGMTRGDWDIYITKEIESFYTWESSVYSFPRIPAGAEGVELRLPREGEVRVRLRLHGAAPESVSVLHGKLFPHDPARAKELARTQMRVSSVEDWPVGASFGFSGISGDVDERGVWSHGFYETDQLEHELQPMGPGWYVFGIRPSSRDGSRTWSPEATRLLWYEPGEYAIDFDLVPTTELSGRLLADASGEHLGVELCTLAGAPVPLESLPGFARPKHALETDARGRFVMRHAPVGTFVLRAGSMSELERGEFRREQRVELVAGANAPVLLTLP